MRATGRDEQEVSRLERRPLGIAAEHAGADRDGIDLVLLVRPLPVPFRIFR
jgi:hypothetical protein